MVRLVGAALLLLATGGCASQPAPVTSEAPGFLWALWHGFVAPLTLIAALVHWLAPHTPIGEACGGIRAYAFPNTGPLYDFGFLIGLSAWGGGGAYAGARDGEEDG